jgi:hypothetical protein
VNTSALPLADVLHELAAEIAEHPTGRRGAALLVTLALYRTWGGLPERRIPSKPVGSAGLFG